MLQSDSSSSGRIRGAESGGPVVLLVEDNVELLGILQSIFLRHGFQVQAAASVESALPFLLQTTPSVVVCDVMLPGKSGYDLHRELRRNPEWYDIPFVFLTALSSIDDVNRGKISGCDDYVTKPFDPDELIAIVRGRLALSEHRRRMEMLKLEGYRKRVLNTLSHEFRTPLVAIKAGTEILADRNEMQVPELKMLLGSIQRGGERLERLVNNFLLLQQVELGQAAQSCERFRRNIPALLLAEMALDSFQESPGENMIHFADRLGEEALGVVINVYDVHIVHALHHVLSNAVKFGGPNGPIELSLFMDDDCAVFSVRDRGPGISETEHSGAFKAFTQINREVNEQQGAGLGLTVAKYFVEMNGGALQFCKPEDGIGLDARLRFPRVA